MEILIKRTSRIRRELLDKALREYLEKHPEEAKDIVQPEKKVEAKPTPGPDWPGWRALSKGEHKKGDWVVGTKCSWNGTISNYEEKVPACHEEIPPYKFEGKYQQNCCREHDLYVLMAYTIEQIRYCNNRKIYNDRTRWGSPLSVAELSKAMIELEDKTFKFYTEDNHLNKYAAKVLTFLEHPVFRIKFPHVYGESVKEALAKWRGMTPFIANMIVSDMVKRKITPERIAWAYDIPREEVDRLHIIAAKQ